jgi:thiosulfate/3-mercaptopyruvate sulfurtransferase
MYPTPIVSTEWLAAHLDDPSLRIVDIRGHVLPATEPPPHYFNHRADYDVSHLPGAVFIDWVQEITDPGDPRHSQIAKPDRYAAVMSRHGIGPETFVVTYDDSLGMLAARLWWSLNYYGHTNVAVLDGGWPKWVKEGRPVTADVPTIAPATFAPRPTPALHRSAAQIAAALDEFKSGATKLLDLRSKDEYDGKASRVERRGHIPGATSSPRQNYIDVDSGTILPPDVLREKFAAIGVDKAAPEVVTYCNGGVSASFGLLALRLAGFENVAMYDGSWKEWGSDTTKPIE